MIGADVVTLNSSVMEERPTGRPDEFERAMKQLSTITRSLSARLGVRLDPAGERISVVDNRGQDVAGWTLLAVVCALALRERAGGTIAVPVHAPQLFEKIAAKHGGQVVRTKLDAKALMEAATRDGVIVAGDDRGGLAFPQFQPAMDGLFAVVKLLELLATQQADLSAEIAALPRYHMASTKVACPWESKGKVMRLLSQQYQSNGPRSVDGVRIDLGSTDWVLILPDPDRPLFHVIAEGESSDGAHTLMEKYAALVSSLQR